MVAVAAKRGLDIPAAQAGKVLLRRLYLPDLAAHAVQHLLPFVTDPDVEVRKAAVRALGRTKDERVAAPLINALRDTDGDVREAAVAGLSQLNDPRAIEPLTRVLGDPRHEVRWRAARALDDA